MPIDYKLSKIIIRNFRGVDSLEIDLRDGFPTLLIGSNNAGKSTILTAIALTLNNPSFSQWTAEETDFYVDTSGSRANEFVIQVLFSADREEGYPAVHGVGAVQVVHGVQMKGRNTKAGKISCSRTLLDSNLQSITISTRSPLSAGDKQRFAEHDVNYRPVNARLDDIHDFTPEVWLFKPQNIEASLYVWRTGPIQKLSKLLAQRFLVDDWVLEVPGGNRKMPCARRSTDAIPIIRRKPRRSSNPKASPRRSI